MERKTIDIRSRHDIIMQEYENERKVTTYSPEENAAILKGLHNGTAEFNLQCMNAQKESETELRDIELTD